ncbi:hypothetical protein JY97_10065 [Alkalispirochaeta odontotermitis]|nr:hypothetical protein JY97_10065 [Alkalispirochaeta odontotermitis]
MRFGTFKADNLGIKNPMEGMLTICFLLAGIGSALLFSASWYFARTIFDDPFRIWRRQLLWMLIGAALSLLIVRVPKSRIRKSVPALIWAALALNALTYIPGIGYTSGGAKRWIEIFGLTFQTSEFTKVALVLYLARMLEKNQNRLDNFRVGLLPSLIVILVLVLTVYLQNDFSTATFLLLLALGLFYVAGVPKALIGISIIGAIISIASMLLAKQFRIERIKSWLSPMADPSGKGYQILKAQAALERGGAWGRGLGRGETKLGGLPAAHSDFVVAVLGEEAGLIGVFAILALFTIFAIKGWLAIEKVPDLFSRWAIFGLVSAVYWQALMNFAVVSGLLPATGIPLPLFSAGGSAAFITLIVFGLIFNLSEVTK